ncbi:MAG: DUF4386 family protein [Chloroflexota bacterium]
MNLQKIPPWAAYLSAAAGLGSLIVAFGLIGPRVLMDPARLVELAQRNPMPLLLQDTMKFISGILALVLIAALYRSLHPVAPKRSLLAAVCGLGSVLALLANASLSLFATTQAKSLAQGEQFNALIALLGMLSIFLNGPWYSLNGWAALNGCTWPRPLAYLGIGMGLLSLLPFLGIFVLLLSLIWLPWLGRVLQKEDALLDGGEPATGDRQA